MTRVRAVMPVALVCAPVFLLRRGVVCAAAPACAQRVARGTRASHSASSAFGTHAHVLCARARECCRGFSSITANRAVGRWCGKNTTPWARRVGGVNAHPTLCRSFHSGVCGAHGTCACVLQRCSERLEGVGGLECAAIGEVLC